MTPGNVLVGVGVVLLGFVLYLLVLGLLGRSIRPGPSAAVVLGLAVDLTGRGLDADTVRSALATSLRDEEGVEVSVKARRGQLEFLLYGEDAGRLRRRATAAMQQLDLPAQAFRIEQLR